MKIAPLAQVKDQLSAYVQESQKSPIIITKNGKPVALLTGLKEDADVDTLMLAHDPRFIKILEEARARVQGNGGVKHDGFWKAVKRRRTRKKDSQR